MTRYLAICSVWLLAACGSNDSDTPNHDAGGGGTGAQASGGTGNTGTGGVGNAGAGGTAGSAGTAGSGATAGAAGSGQGGSAGTAGSCGNCEFACCGDQCTNLDNDIENCGVCGKQCTGTAPYCDHGSCKDAPPCAGPSVVCQTGTVCCGNQCCAAGTICCDVPGPVSNGNSPSCVAPIDGTCPIGCKQCKCNAPETPIATPRGNRPIAELRVGDLVYSVNGGKLAVVRIARVQRVPAPHHFVMQIRLESGVTLRISPRHPTVDGRTFGDLRPGASLDGVRVVSAELVPYHGSHTYDILPESDSGAYYAGGVLIGSTMTKSPTTPLHAVPVSLVRKP